MNHHTEQYRSNMRRGTLKVVMLHVTLVAVLAGAELGRHHIGNYISKVSTATTSELTNPKTVPLRVDYSNTPTLQVLTIEVNATSVMRTSNNILILSNVMLKSVELK